MFSRARTQYQILYFTTPFCGVCKSAKPLIRMLAMSLDVPFVEQNLHTFVNDYEALTVRVTPAVALVYDKDVIYYTDEVNNLSDLYQRFEQARSSFNQRMKNA